MNSITNFYREYAYDFACSSIEEYNLDIIKRVALAGMPFVTQLEPVKKYFSYITYGMSALRIGTTGYSAYKETEFEGKVIYSAQCLYTIASVAATTFDHTYGRAMIGAIDTLHTLYDAYNHSDDKEKWLSEYCVQVLAQVIHIGLLYEDDFLPLVLLMYITQFALATLAACREEAKGRYIEMTAHLFTSLIYLCQGLRVYGLIMEEEPVFEEMEEVPVEITQRLSVDMSMEEPSLEPVFEIDLKERLIEVIDKRSVWIKDADGKTYNLGAHIHGFGPKVTEDHNLCFRRVEEKGKSYVQLSFRVNQYAMQKLKHLPSKIQSNVLDYPKLRMRITGVYLDPNDLNLSHVVLTMNHARLDANDECNYIHIRAPEKDCYRSIHDILTAVGLENVLQAATLNDEERLKIVQFTRAAQLFNFFHTDLSHLSGEQLKAYLTQQDSKMHSYMNKYMADAQLLDVIPGCSYYYFPRLAELAQENGAASLTASIISSTGWNKYKVAQRTASIIKNGLLSSNTRADASLSSDGYLSGSARSTHETHAFTQIIAKGEDLSDLLYSGPVRLIISPQLLGMCKLQDTSHESDARIKRNDETFFDFVSRIPYLYSGHEILTPHAIPPEMIQGIVVKKKYMGHVIKALEDAKLIIDGCINGIPVENFIQEADSVDPQIYRNAERYRTRAGSASRAA